MEAQSSSTRPRARGGGRSGGRGGQGSGQKSRGRGGSGEGNPPKGRGQGRGRGGGGGRRSQGRDNAYGSNQQPQPQSNYLSDAAMSTVNGSPGSASDLRDEASTVPLLEHNDCQLCTGTGTGSGAASDTLHTCFRVYALTSALSSLNLQDILIAFMPYLKADHPTARSIHEEYQLTNDSKTFVRATREFLANPTATNLNNQSRGESSSVPAPASTKPPTLPMSAPSESAYSMGQDTPPIPKTLPLPLTGMSSAPMSRSGTSTPLQVASTPPIQSPMRPSIGYPIRPLTTTPTSNSNQSPSSFSMSHPMSFSSSTNSPTPMGQTNPPSFYLPPTLQQHQPLPPPPPHGPGARPPAGFPSNPNHGMHVQHQQQQRSQHFNPPPSFPQGHPHPQMYQQNNQSISMMESLELQLDRLMGGDDDDDDLPLSAPPTPSHPAMAAIGTPTQRNNPAFGNANGAAIGTPTPKNGSVNGGKGAAAEDHVAASFLSSLLASSSPISTPVHRQYPQQQPQQPPLQHQQAHPGSVAMPPMPRSLVAPGAHSSVRSDHTSSVKAPSQSHSPLSLTPAQLSPIQQSQPAPQHGTKTPRKETVQQKRLWTHTDEQPGRVTVNDINVSSPHIVLDVRPRQELGARWILSYKYLQQRAEELARRKFESATGDADDEQGFRLQLPRLIRHDDNPLNRLLPDLRLGLFRRGCAENGSQASIISKSVMMSGGGRPPYLDAQSQMVIGTVPFYSPRTPGHVIFRLYWDDDPLYTLAVGPTLHVRVAEDDYEGTIRFLLSNMKKKVNPTSLSSLHSLALVLETPLHSPQHHPRGRHQQHQQQQSNDRAGRATWGCICEARKVLDACAAEYTKTNQRLGRLAAAVEEMKAEIEDEAKVREGDEDGDEDQTTATNDMNGADGKFDDASNDASGLEWKVGDPHERDEEKVHVLREKTRALMSGRASCERKWRDSQLAFASILKVSN
jgi:hypothetical protein